MTKIPVKFKKDWLRTIGVDAHTRYLLLEGGMEPWNYGKLNTMSPRFSSTVQFRSDYCINTSVILQHSYFNKYKSMFYQSNSCVVIKTLHSINI